MKTFFLGLLLSSMALASADLARRPRSFNLPKGKAVFVDYQDATYQINYDLVRKSATVMADMRFTTLEEGFPIFDSVQAPTSVFINGEEVTSSEINTPSNETTVRVVDRIVAPGDHRLTVVVPLRTLVDFSGGGVKSAFWTSDLRGRGFLERYLPANLEYDQVRMTFIVRFFGAKNRQRIYTNGVVREKSEGTFTIQFPPTYNASSVYFHTVPETSVEELRFNLKSVDGRDIPAVVYMQKPTLSSGKENLERFRKATTEIFHELEGDYGAWPHQSLTVYNAGTGGMEYCGATITEMRALGHELFHSYFARGVMPANGNAGWIDEALASWRDKNYDSIPTLEGTSRMSSRPYYTRETDATAYTFGERFMAHMDHKLKSKGGLKPFMRYLVDRQTFSPLFVEDFIAEMTKFFGVSVEADFRRYTFGTKNDFQLIKETEHPIHRKMSIEELQAYL